MIIVISLVKTKIMVIAESCKTRSRQLQTESTENQEQNLDFPD